MIGLRLCVLLVIIFPLHSTGQKIKCDVIAKLPHEISESSGIVVADSNLVWTMNDSGGGNAIFLVNSQGELLKTLLLNATQNHDWEDLTSDSAYLYIGDFGNNANRRRDLAIYKFPRAAASDSDHFMPQIISFTFADQTAFPPKPGNWNYDCEAFFHLDDSLYLFSKNNSNPTTGCTKLYRLPDQEGTYRAQPVDSFCVHEPVTGAAVSADGKTVVLLTYFSLWIFRDFPGRQFFSGSAFQFPIRGLTQKEAICFSSNQELLVTDERRFGKGGKLYSVDLDRLDFTPTALVYRKQSCKQARYNAFNNPKRSYNKIMKQEAAR